MRRIILVWIGCVLVSAMTAAAATGNHLEGSTLYPRLIRLHYAPHSLKGTLLAKTGNKLYRSTDEGHTFTYLASVGSTGGSRERCCSTVYELPRKMGKLRAGTLLYSGSFFSGDVPAIEIYTSTDEGNHWKYLTTPIKAGDKHHGLWEPEFTTAKDGSLVTFFSDETDACCSQKLAQMRTRDGVHWSAKQDTVASSSQKDRPGMAVVTRLPDKTYFMSYEICGPVTHCQVYFRHSADGWNFGDAAGFGVKAVTATGQYFAHAPANIFDPASGQILLAGQVLYEEDGKVSGQNGQLLFTRGVPDGAGAWSTRPAPVAVPTAYDNYCPNYSSALMPVRSGLLELASDYDNSQKCTSYVAILPIR